MLYQYPVTPADINSTLVTLCAELAPGIHPFYVDARPLPDAPVNHCFGLVEEQARRCGGTRILGWALWEMPGIFVEAEFHAVWKSPADEYFDIAPKPNPMARILFLPSHAAEYDGRQVNNQRRAIGGDPDVERYLRGFDDRFELMTRGERAGRHGKVELRDGEVDEYEEIQRRLIEAHAQIAHRFPRSGPYLPCLCGSGKKTKWCHPSK